MDEKKINCGGESKKFQLIVFFFIFSKPRPCIATINDEIEYELFAEQFNYMFRLSSETI